MLNEKIEKLREIVKGSRSIVFFGGAGVSTESGIPDFRSEAGLYKAVSNYGYSPEEMLSHTFFVNHTEEFYDYYKNNLIYREAGPNDAHKVLSELEKIGKLKAIVTQNIDGLHQKAGSVNVFELHGSMARNYCMSCNKFFDMDYILDESHCRNLVPVCDSCGGTVKPEVVLYEEPLDEAQITGAVNAIENADTLIVGGTSLVVHPAAGLIRYFKGNNIVLINKSSTQFDSRADLVINESIGKVLSQII